jgi:quinol monooxygenase YgiN
MESRVSRLYTTRIWVAQTGQGDEVRTLLEELQRLAERIPGVEICLYQEHASYPHASQERFVTFSEWPDRQAIQTFRDHPDAQRIHAALPPLISETYPRDGALELDEVRS